VHKDKSRSYSSLLNFLKLYNALTITLFLNFVVFKSNYNRSLTYTKYTSKKAHRNINMFRNFCLYKICFHYWCMHNKSCRKLCIALSTKTFILLTFWATSHIRPLYSNLLNHKRSSSFLLHLHTLSYKLHSISSSFFYCYPTFIEWSTPVCWPIWDGLSLIDATPFVPILPHIEPFKLEYGFELPLVL